MSHPNYNYNTQGRSLRQSLPSGDSHSGSSYSEQGHGSAHDHHNIDVADRGMVDYHNHGDPAIQYANVGRAHGIHTQAQPNAAENQEDVLFGRAYPVAPVPIQAAFYDPFAHQPEIPAPVQPTAGNLRRLVDHYLYQPDSQVDLVSMEPGAAGRCKVLIILDVADVL